MSKAKPKSMEQLLEEALVPKDEQPYEVPGNWVWVKFGVVAKLFNGYAFKSTDYSDEGIPIIRISDLNGMETTPETAVRVPRELYNEKFLVRKGDLLIAMSGATTGKIGIYNSDEIAMQNQRVGNIKTINDNILYAAYRNYFVISSSTEISKLAYGGAQPNISGALIESLSFPLPPLNEQKRIADKIERLFAKIDEAKRLIEEVKESIEQRRAVILEKAFKGQLGTNDPSEKSILETSDDLSEKDVIPKEQWPYEVPGNWVWVKFGVVAKLFNGYAFKSTDYSDEGIPIIRISDLNGMETTPETAVRVPRELYNEKFLVRKGDLLIAMSGATTGKIGIYNSDEIAMQNQRVGNIKTINDNILYAAYRNYFVISSSTEISKLAYGGAQPNISGALIESLPFPLPPLNEQKRIAEKLDNLLEKLENEKQLVLAVEEKLDLLKQSVLQKAFRGELGTNDPNDGHAMELVKEALLSSSGQR
ncbi:MULTISPECIES: restriction endonuclease subunit S [Geobacillus]|uniref:Type I restriction-modification system, specificity subunit S n=7 Tax=Geobacillus TaxID=129337 RepID=A0A1Q5SYW6_9BACL|nr:restriction endonuclease subunit S [Geobacillus proteiniphilus]OKO93142.1 Type I restriction-modification system, specificity subunit S [Geobacillus proteiniphilus]